jgi:hypothetical protein
MGLTRAERPNSGRAPSHVARADAPLRVEAGRDVLVHLPYELPGLTPYAARMLSDILRELTSVEIPDGPPGDASDDNY